MEQELPLQSNASITVNRDLNHIILSRFWIRLLLIGTTVKSILGLVILCLLLGISIGILIIGSYFQHLRHCPIEPKISLFLIVAGSGSVEWVVLSIILSIITIVLKRVRSLLLIVLIIVIALTIIITNLFLFVWVICGSVWTLRALDTVQYTSPYVNTFCQRTLYQSALGYLIFTYILTALQCWYRLCIVIFCSVQEQYI